MEVLVEPFDGIALVGLMSFIGGLHLGTLVLIWIPLCLTAIGYLGRKKWESMLQALIGSFCRDREGIGTAMSVSVWSSYPRS